MESIAAPRPKPPRQTHGLPWLGAGALFGAIAVGAGAYGSHALRAELAEPLLVMYETAVRYQMYHALALLAVGALGHVLSRRALTLTGSFFIAGILLFSGSLYALSLTGERPFPLMTPAGGVCFILGWLTLAVAAMATAKRH